uniref:B30.2/SPRY domain-containing protein n=1 Tax=Pseudictyota dubia TaxID=2749911 RepID=A0A7R9VB79_9STRA|mmetsp:Transcript_10176/g.19494  ORF Transcript_10176/g.19494 Transcript_10176/m.19494 type:complete len:314 (+) Transcript_10176:236-1177(+)
MNSLKSTSNNWIGDGSDGNLSVEGTTISFGSSKRGTPYNVRLDDDSISPSESMFYEIEIVELNGTIAVGAVTKEKFLPGWKSRGIFYNGNLTNGSAALLCSFGKFVAVGDTVGVFIRRDDNGLKAFFYVNGRCLGEAFRLDGAKDVFYPCLHVSGSSVVKYKTPDSLPSETNRQPSERPDAYSGEWELTKAFDGPELGERPLPDNHKIILNLQSSGEKSYRLSVKVGNTLSTSIDIIGKLEAFDAIKVGECMSTMMMPPPELFEFEQFLNSSLPELRKMIVSEGGDLILSGATSELIARQYEKKFEPLTKYEN